MDFKIIDYIIVGETIPQMLANKIRENIDLGWQPFGNICTEDGNLYQPMVRYSSDKKANE